MSLKLTVLGEITNQLDNKSGRFNKNNGRISPLYERISPLYGRIVEENSLQDNFNRVNVSKVNCYWW